MPEYFKKFELWLQDRPLTTSTGEILLVGSVSMMVALLIRLLIAPVDAGLQYVTFFPAVTLATLLAGVRAGLLVTMLGMFFATWIFTPPYWEFDIASIQRSLWSNSVFLIDGLIVSYAIDAMRRYRIQYQVELAETRKLQKQQEANAIQQRRFQEIVQTSDDAIISKSLNGVVESWNPGAEKIFGYTAAEMVGSTLVRLFPAALQQQEAEMLEKISLGQRVDHFETQRLHKNGTLLEVSVTISPLYDAAGNVVGVSKIARDITQQKMAEHQLQLFFELLPDVLCIADSDGHFRRVNTGFSNCLGWSAEELLAQHWCHFIHPDDVEASKQILSRGERLLTFENRFRHKDGSWRTLSWLACTDGGDQIFASARDVTEARQHEHMLREARELAERAARLKTSFLATMSHEIRTPLGGMLGMLELLSMSELDAEQMATLMTAQNSGHALLRIVNDILDWSKIEEGKLEITPTPTLLRPLLQEVVDTYSRVSSSKSLNLWCHIDPRLVHTYLLDPLRLSQILNNFTSNAIKFTLHGEIEVRAELFESDDTHDRVHFTVKDTGMGIPEAEQANLFRDYAQVSSSGRMYGGTGLGLSICRRLVEMMGGELTLLSQPGRGSTFGVTLNLPRTDLLPQKVYMTHHAVTQHQIRPLFESAEDAPLILIVDDHPTNRDLLARQVTTLGIRAKTAENGRVGLSLWQDGRFALIISDCHMPDMDGYEMSKAIRRTEAAKGLPRTPIIAWTANALPEEIERIQKADMDELLVKPVDLETLSGTLARWLLPQSSSDTPHAAAGVAAPRQPVQADRPLINFSILDSVIADRNEQTQVLRQFMQHLATDRTHLDDLLAQRDIAAVRSAAHRMKGSSRMVGAVPLGEICAALEDAARQEALDLDEVSALLLKLDAAMAEVQAYVTGLP